MSRNKERYPVALFNPCEGLKREAARKAADRYISTHLQGKKFTFGPLGFEFAILKVSRLKMSQAAYFEPENMGFLSVFEEFVKTSKWVNSKPPKPAQVKKYDAVRVINLNGFYIEKGVKKTLKTTLIMCKLNKMVYCIHEHEH